MPIAYCLRSCLLFYVHFDIDGDVDICEILSAVPYFRGLDEETVCSILEYSYEKNIPRGQYLFAADEVCRHLYVIKQGLIEIFQIGEDGKKISMHHAGRGAFLGDTILFNEGRYGAHAYAMKTSSLLAIDKKSFEQLIYTHPEIGIRMLSDFGLRIKKLQSFVAGIALTDVRMRIIKLLLELVDEGGAGSKDSVVLTNVPTQDEMAYRIGTVREVLCRGLHKLEKDKLIKVKRGEVTIFNIQTLRDMSPREEDNSLFPIPLPNYL